MRAALLSALHEPVLVMRACSLLSETSALHCFACFHMLSMHMGLYHCWVMP